MLALIEHPLSYVCFSEMFLHKSALAVHICVHLNETSLNMFAWENTIQLTLQRTLKFPLHTSVSNL